MVFAVVLLTLVAHLAVAGLLLLASRSVIWINVVAFLVAFWISLFGHLRYSFPHAGPPLATSVRRYVAASLAAFAINQTALVVLLWITEWPQYLALALATSLAAAVTFQICRAWVLRDAQ